MSGIITNPHFRNYFHSPDALAIGTMVAVLELGALGQLLLLIVSLLCLNNTHSNVSCRWPSGRHLGPQRHTFHWRNNLHCWRCYSDIHEWFCRHGRRPNCQRLRSGFAIVSVLSFDVLDVC